MRVQKGKLLNDQVVRRKKKKKRLLPLVSLVKVLGSGILKVSLLLVLLTIVSVGFLSGYHYLLTSPYLGLEKVEIRGCNAGTKQDLVKRSDLREGMSLLAVNLKALKTKLETHPWVRSVKVERRFPHTLLIEAEEQSPLAVVVMDKLYYMNRQGELFKEVSESESVDFPFVTGVSAEDRDLREKLSRSVDVMHFLSGEEGEWSLKALSEVHVRGKRDLSLYFKDLGAEIRLSPAEIFDKMDQLKKVVRDLGRNGRIRLMTGIDLNYPDGAVVSFKKG